jgi:hypothetical protein
MYRIGMRSIGNDTRTTCIMFGEGSALDPLTRDWTCRYGFIAIAPSRWCCWAE